MLGKIIDIVLFLAVVGSGGYVLFILVKKFPVISNINVNKLPDVERYRVKKKILEDRLRRDFQRGWGYFYDSFVRERQSAVARWFSGQYQKLKEREEEYRQSRHDDLASGIIKARSRDELVAMAREALVQKQLSRAEKLLIEALKVDEHNVRVYMLLVDVYREQEMFDQAKETLQYVEHLTEGKDPAVYIDLAQLSWERGDMHGAFEGYSKAVALDPANYKYHLELAFIHESAGQYDMARDAGEKAFQLAPNNPKILDFLIENCIILQDKNRAEGYLAKLVEVNPQNGKIGSFRDRIASLS